MIGLVFVLTIIKTILDVIVGVKERDYVKNTFNQLLKEKNITNYQYIRTAGNQILIDDRDILYVIHDKGWVSRGYGRITDIELSIDDSVAFQSSLKCNR